jgi:Bacterial EndoU nuclease
MASDSPSRGYQDYLGSSAEARPDGYAVRAGSADIPAARSHPAEMRHPAGTWERAAYYEAVRTATGPRLDGHPAPDAIRLPPERARHILDGDSWGGGHRHGTGRPGKAEFPAGWDDERTIGYIVDVARRPDTRPVWQPNHRWRLHGERDAVGVTVIVKPDGGIWAAWPEEGGPGVVRNPSEGRQ